ncbi:chaperonin 10-like protein [Aspergillus foveolatus]|uniref:chaperonin 10-like protein n=1 Tax=Aspergillus foveolatus TaxID=210207 RepID=UPI003CCDCED4
MTYTDGTMKAAQWDPNQQKVVVNRIPIPSPGPNQILVKLASASLCHSDILAINQPNMTEPFTLGHEGAGYVAELGAECTNKGFREGDPVGFLYINGCCFECEGCMVHNNHCTQGTPIVSGFGGVRDFGFFQEYAAVDWQNIIHLPSQLDPKRSSAIFCAGITAFHAVDSCNLMAGQWFAAIGAGGLGQLAVQYAKAMGYRVIAIDINDEALETCKRQGADVIINSLSRPDYASEIKKLTNGGVHATAVFSGAAAAYRGAPSIIRPGGVLMVIGISSSPLELSTFDLAIGTYVVKSESTSIPHRMAKAVDFTAKYGITPEIEVRSGLEDVDVMVRDMQAGKSSRRMAVVFE